MSISEENAQKEDAQSEAAQELSKRLQYEAAADEWDELPELLCADTNTAANSASVSTHVNYAQMWAYFKEKDLSAHMENIHPTLERRGGCKMILCHLLGPPQLDKRLVPERDRIFAIAQCQLDNEDPRQVQMLMTIYKRLTSTRLDCPRFGHHWETIGFQGSDPATDLRGAGLLSPLNTLFLLSAANHRHLAADTYRLSLSHTQNFPFMVLCINITRLALNALRHGVLNRECNLRLAVMDVFNEYYACILCEFYRIWKTQGRTIADSGNVLKDLEHQSLKRYKSLRAGMCAYLTQLRSREATSTCPKGGGNCN